MCVFVCVCLCMCVCVCVYVHIYVYMYTCIYTHVAYNLAQHLDERNENEEAALWYKKAIKIDMDHGPALSNYASLLWKHYQDKENSQKFHQRALRASPNDAVYYIIIVIRVLQLGPIIICSPPASPNDAVYCT